MKRKTKAYDGRTTKNKIITKQSMINESNPHYNTQHIFIFTVLVTAILFFIGTGLFSGFICSDVSVVEANQQIGELQYKVIEIQKGDSLWSIAKENMNPGFDDVFSYIHEVKRCNQLESDTITAGNYLMIPYYE